MKQRPNNAHLAQTGVYVIADKMFSNFMVPLLIKIANAAGSFITLQLTKMPPFFVCK